MAVKTIFRPVTLCGDQATPGIKFSDGALVFSPRWGMTRGCAESIATAMGEISDTVSVVITDTMLVIVPTDGVPSQELVLVKEYYTGVGAKRRPGFKVEHDLRTVASESTAGGSGWERWSLVIAPLGWAENIAAQFQDYKDIGDQTISYKSTFSPQSQPEPFEDEGREIAEELVTRFGEDVHSVIEREYNAVYGRRRRQQALERSLPSIADMPKASKLVFAGSRSRLDALLKQTLAAL